MSLVVLGLAAAPASAHGPCRCLPSTAQAGDEVVIGKASKVVWNPTRDDVYYAEPNLVDAHVENTPRRVLLDRDLIEAGTPAKVVVPDVPPGKYVVLVYDGTEGGSHYTWDEMTVRAGSATAGTVTSAASDAASGDDAFPIAAVAAGSPLVTAGLLIALRRRRSPRADAS